MKEFTKYRSSLFWNVWDFIAKCDSYFIQSLEDDEDDDDLDMGLTLPGITPKSKGNPSRCYYLEGHDYNWKRTVL